MDCMSSAGSMLNNTTYLQQLKANIVPQASSITYDATFHKYYFKFLKYKSTQEVEVCSTYAKSFNPLTNELENYLGLSLMSCFDGKNERRDLNLFVVLDKSGSMNSNFPSAESEITHETKMTVANFCLAEIVKILKPHEKIGVIVFDSTFKLLQDLKPISAINAPELLLKITNISAGGGTNMEDPYERAITLMEESIQDISTSGAPKNNRIIFLTDANPNLGGGVSDLEALSKRAAKSKIYTTFIGVGLDFDTNIVKKLAKVKGTNYFSVESKKDFLKVLKDDFNYVVTPIAFEARCFLKSSNYEIIAAFGENDEEDEENKSNSNLIKMQTLMASDIDEIKGIKGGIALVKLKKKDFGVNILKAKESENSTLETKDLQNSELILKYENYLGEIKEIRQNFNFDIFTKEEEFFESEGIRKAIALQRAVDVMKEHARVMNLHSQKNVDLKTTDELKIKISIMRKYLSSELEVLKDSTMNEEIEILDALRFAEQIKL